jgi:hypothetical protein
VNDQRWLLGCKDVTEGTTREIDLAVVSDAGAAFRNSIQPYDSVTSVSERKADTSTEEATGASNDDLAQTH